MPQLAGLIRAKYPGVYDDLDDAALETAVKAKYPGVYDDLAEPADDRSMLEKAGEWLPTAGGAIGGIAGMAGGPVVAAGLAGLGGAAGRMGQRAIEGMHKRDIPQGMDLAADAGLEGAKQGGMELIGGAISGALGKGASRLYQGLAKPSTALRREFPDAVQTALRERIPISSGGMQKVEGKLAASSDDATQAIDKAAQGGASNVQPAEVIREFRPVVSELRKRAQIGQPDQLSAVGERGKRLVASHPQGIPLKLAQELKKTAQTAAQGAYRAKDRGLAKELAPSDLLDEASARGLRKGIEKRVPEAAGINQRSQSLIGVDRMVGDAVGRDSNTLMVNGMRSGLAIGAGAGIGSLAGDSKTGAGAGLLLQLLSTPSTGSRAAILANELKRLPYAQGARILAQLMSSHDPQQ